MYYLLEDNRIVNSLSIREDLDLLVGIDFYVEKDEIVLTIGYIYIERISIIKKAENVLDFIENGDLVKLDKTLNKVITILKEGKRTFFEIGDNKWFSYKELNNYLNNNLLAIYKPDEFGNYIKVWEEKDNE